MNETKKPLTMEQALQNVAVAAERYVGNKQEHIVLEQSVNLIKSVLYPPKKAELVEADPV